MDAAELPAVLEDLAERLVLADLRDRQAVLGLQAGFRRVAGLAASAGLAAAHPPVEAALGELDRLLADPAAGGSGSSALLNRSHAALVALSHDQTPPATAAHDAPLAEFLVRHHGFADEASAQIIAAAAGSAADLAACRRSLHTLKGDAGMLGLGDLSQVCHSLESALCDGDRLPVDAVFKALEWLAGRLAQLGGEDQEAAPAAAVVAWLEAACQAVAAATPSAAPGPADDRLVRGGPLPDQASPELVEEFLGTAHEHAERLEEVLLGLQQRTDPQPAALPGLFRSFHALKGLAGFLGLNREQALAHAAEDRIDALRRGEQAWDGADLQLLLRAVDALNALLAGLAGACAGTPRPDSPDLPGLIAALRGSRPGSPQGGTQRIRRAPALGEILVEAGTVSRAAVDAALAAQAQLGTDQRLGEILVEAGHLTTSELSGALGRQGDGPGRHGPTVMATTMRVEVGRVEVLNEAVGELVIAQNMLRCAPELRGLADRRLHGLLAQLDRVTRTVQGLAMQLRLVAIKPVFQRLLRLAHDAARKLDKEIEVVLVGEDLDLDKSLADRLGDPLSHLVRNACDHGIETSPAERRAAGKPACGRIVITAFRTAGSFCVSVRDDGRGLDCGRILARARERGLIGADHEPSGRELAELVFLPGFSTAAQVTEVSGRGVGMDVVKRMVDELHGNVALDWQTGQGSTCLLYTSPSPRDH
jgi:two-component system chemotaxis sensor kinase CheA